MCTLLLLPIITGNNISYKTKYANAKFIIEMGW